MMCELPELVLAAVADPDPGTEGGVDPPSVPKCLENAVVGL